MNETTLTPAEQHLVRAIVRHAPNFTAKHNTSPPPPPLSRRLARARPYAVGLLSVGTALLLTIEAYGSDKEPQIWLFMPAVCLAFIAAGVKAGRFAAGLALVSYVALLLTPPRYLDLWQVMHQPKLWHLLSTMASLVLCMAPRGGPGAYQRRMRRIIASITASISASLPKGLPERSRSISTS
jgi:hypothetical protein